MTVRLTKEAQANFESLPTTIKVGVLAIFERLQQWPNVSGAKPLRGKLAGHYRVRTGDWRVVFRQVSPDLLIVRIMHRSEVYEE